MTQPLSSHGTILKLGDGEEPEVFTEIAEIVDASGPSITKGTHDAPNQNTTWMKRVVGLLNAGDVTFDVNFIPTDATHGEATGLIGELKKQTPSNWQMVYSDIETGSDSQWDFEAFCTSFGQDVPVDGILKSSVTLVINGEPILTPGVPT
jgi:hypothetical protein